MPGLRNRHQLPIGNFSQSMKRFIYNIITLVVALLIFASVAPRFLSLDNIHTEFVDLLKKELRSEVEVRSIHWTWLPIPHLSVSGIKADNEQLSMTLPKIELYPRWQSLFEEKNRLARIHLIDPVIRVDSLATLAASQETLATIRTIFTVENGTLQFEQPANTSWQFQQETITASSIAARIEFRESIRFKAAARMPFCDTLSLQGNLIPETSSYNATFAITGLQPDQLLKSMFDGLVLPGKSIVDMTGQVSGQGMETIQVGITGELPGFYFGTADEKVFLAGGTVDLDLVKSDRVFQLQFKDLKLSEPALQLAGTIARKTSDSGQQWFLDLSGQDIDLVAVRQRLLDLWPENHVARIVCGIVKGGTAKSAGYQFAGSTADFHDITAMIIRADIVDAPIHVPGTGLELDSASGPIRIWDGRLFGEDLQGRMGANSAANGRLVLGLAPDDHAFRLDLDLDVDLADLPPVLDRLITHHGFQAQLDKFRAISGRARGSLHLHDSLKAITTEVEVREIRAAGQYLPIPWPVTIKSGTLQIRPGLVSWENVNAVTGFQQIFGATGAVSWDETRKPSLTILPGTRAALSSAPLYLALRDLDLVPESIGRNIATLQGPLGITAATFSGPLAEPENWHYVLTVDGNDLQLTSPRLPGIVGVDRFKATVTEDTVAIADAGINILAQPFRGSGSLRHSLLEGWAGEILIDGILSQDIAHWLGDNNYLPIRFMPKTPSLLQQLRLASYADLFTAEGTIVSDPDDILAPRINFLIESTPSQLAINKLEVIDRERQASIAFTMLKNRQPAFNLKWEGIVKASTLNRILQNNILEQGELTGSFILAYDHQQPGETYFKGTAEAADLQWHFGEQQKTALLRHAILEGSGRELFFKDLDLGLDNDKLNLKGVIKAAAEGLRVSMTSRSASLSQPTLSSLREMLQPAGPETDPPRTLPTVAGEITFAVDNYLAPGLGQAEDAIKPLVIEAIQGAVNIKAVDDATIDIRTAKLCGLDLTGSIDINGVQSGRRFQLQTAPDQPAYFQEVLPCLGIAQDLIDGEFTAAITIDGTNNQWQAGSARIESSQGRILRMQLLSRIFSLINITDMFAASDLPGSSRGFAYSQLELASHVENNRLLLDKVAIHGDGLNLFARGDVDINTLDADIIVLVAPLKTLDTIITSVPLVGGVLGDNRQAIIAIPVGLKGRLDQPVITLLPATAVGDAILNLVKDTLMLPFTIFKPILPE